MSNEYKDWIEDLKNAPIGSNDHRRWLLMEYPWLAINKSEAINYMDVEDDDIYTFIDCAPKGWAKLCEDLCAELKPLLEKVGYVDGYKLCQVKEKYGGLRWYEWDVPAAIDKEYFALIRKYEELSYKTCCVCGAPATKMSRGWICPFCDKCAENFNGTFDNIEN